MTIENFEDLKVWQAAFSLTKTVYKITKLNDFEKDFGLKDQIRRASVSVMNNIAEGFDRSGNKEFIQFLAIAKGSVAEVRSMLYIAKDLAYIDSDKFSETVALCHKISKMLGGFIRYLRNSSLKGGKFTVKEEQAFYGK